MHDGIALTQTDEHATLRCNGGQYLAVCGTTCTPAAMTAPDGRNACPLCRQGPLVQGGAMAQQADRPGLVVATCKHCYLPIQRWPGEFWKHKGNQRERCYPGNPRNALMADALPGSLGVPR